LISKIFIGSDGRLRSGWRCLIAFVVVLGTLIGVEYFAAAVSHGVVAHNLITRPLTAIVLFLLFIPLAKRVDEVKHAAEYIGLGTRRPWVRDLIAGLVAGALMVSACIALIALLGHYSITAAPPLQASHGVAAGVVVFILIGGAITEELAFRSYFFLRLVECIANGASALGASKKLADGIGSWAAIAVLAALFGSAHLGNPNSTFLAFANTVLYGVFLGILMLRTGSIWLLWGLHFAWNCTLGLAFGLPVSGISQFSVAWTGVAQGPRWLTGGSYGIEASAPLVVLLLLATVIVTVFRLPASTFQVHGIQSE
jgi:membrane protease YdiL (CAAX protease family)